MRTVVAAVVRDGQLIAVCEDGTAWRMIDDGPNKRWEKLVSRIADFG